MMAFFGVEVRICGVPCALVTRGGANGRYLVTVERERASLEEIEQIDWARPVLTEKKAGCILPEGYGFRVAGMDYDMSCRSWRVELQVLEQYLGDVTEYREKLDKLSVEVEHQAEVIRELESRPDTGAEIEKRLAAAYREGVESNG